MARILILMAALLVAGDRSGLKAQTPATQSDNELIQGRWDSVQDKFEGEKEDSTEWAESLEFSGDRLAVLVYPISETPKTSLIADAKGRTDTFRLFPTDKLGEYSKVDFYGDKGVVMPGIYKLRKEDEVLMLSLGMDGKRPTSFSEGRQILARKAPKPDGPNLQVEDLKKFHGVWRPVGDRSKSDGMDLYLEFKGIKRWAWFTLGQGVMSENSCPIILRPDKNPKELDEFGFLGSEIEHKSIYEFDGEKVRLCVAKEGKDRPTEFKTNDDKGWLTFEIERRSGVGK